MAQGITISRYDGRWQAVVRLPGPQRLVKTHLLRASDGAGLKQLLREHLAQREELLSRPATSTNVDQ